MEVNRASRPIHINSLSSFSNFMFADGNKKKHIKDSRTNNAVHMHNTIYVHIKVEFLEGTRFMI